MHVSPKIVSAELNNDIARKDQYIFRQKDEQRKYNPKYCEQPLVYTLAFLLKILEKGKYRTGALVALKKWFADEYVSLKDLQKEIVAIVKEATLGQSVEYNTTVLFSRVTYRNILTALMLLSEN